MHRLIDNIIQPQPLFGHFGARFSSESIPYGKPIELFVSPRQCSTTGVTEAVVCAILSLVHIKNPLLLIPTPYNCKYNVLSALLNKTFPSFLVANWKEWPAVCGGGCPVSLCGHLPYVPRRITVSKLC